MPTISASKPRSKEQQPSYLHQLFHLLHQPRDREHPNGPATAHNSGAVPAASSTNFLGLGKRHNLPFHNKARSSSPVLKERREKRVRKKIRLHYLRGRCFTILPLLVLFSLLLAFIVLNSHRINLPFWPRTPPDLTRYVNVFRGTAEGGSMFPGVVPAPYSVVKLGPDCKDSAQADAYSGFLPEGNVTGFSMMHESGTGGAPKYGVISQMPVAGAVENPLVDLSLPRLASDHGEVGYYRTWLHGGILVEMAGTDHAGMLRHSFKAGGFENSIVVDVSQVLKSFRGLGWSQEYVKGRFQIHDDGHYEGFGVYKGGWNTAPNYSVYFCGYFDKPASLAQTFTGTGEQLREMGATNLTHGHERLGGVFTFNERPVISRIGISWISSRKACKHVNEEIPEDTDFQSLVNQSKRRWNKEVLSKIQTNPEAQPEHLRQLYSNMYSMYILPTNRTGENPSWKSTEPYYDDIVTYWDLFRCTMALIHILTPESHQEQLRSIVDIWRHDGWLPDGRSSDWTGETQGGSNADNILADAFVKGVELNWTAAYEAMLMNAEVTPPNNKDPRAPDSSTRFGRGALPDWKQYGYITPAFSRAVSRAIEYAANDFSLSQVARGLGKPQSEIDLYLNRSRNWRNHWNQDQKSLGFSGFLVPRDADGTFEHPYDPLQCGDCSWMDPYYEALPWEYTFAAGHHDMAYVINITGGQVPFIRKLQKIHEQWIYQDNSAYNETIIDPSNEPSFNTPYLFHYVNRQDLSVKYSRRSAQFYYEPGKVGLPGSSDSGAMQSWQLWNMIGLYPMVGQRIFLLGSPWFKYMKIDLGKRKKLIITMKGGNVNMEVYYVSSITVNGQKWLKNWVEWSDVFENGGTIHFELSHTPTTDWATGPPPPSPASEEQYQR